jgi:NAD(P)-dependent dehydrogenase (short-subunit alcohol dehydrogenase family)
MKMSLEGKVAVITGGGRGIGKAIALDFAKYGADIVVAARTTSEIDAVANEVLKMGRKALAIPTDMTKEQSIQNLISKSYENFGKIDILVNNAGISFAAAVVDMKTEDFDNLMTVNLRGMFICTREALRFMRKQKQGCIINISSGFGIEGQPMLSAYCASKAGILLFSDSLSKEERKVKVYVINPGLIETKMTESLGGKKESPDVIAKIATYLALPENKFPTGMVIKQLQLDNIKAAVTPLIEGRTFPNWTALFQEVKSKLDAKILGNIEKYKVMLSYWFKEYIQ